jgi:hypothetical protein
MFEQKLLKKLLNKLFNNEKKIPSEQKILYISLLHLQRYNMFNYFLNKEIIDIKVIY